MDCADHLIHALVAKRHQFPQEHATPAGCHQVVFRRSSARSRKTSFAVDKPFDAAGNPAYTAIR